MHCVTGDDGLPIIPLFDPARGKRTFPRPEHLCRHRQCERRSSPVAEGRQALPDAGLMAVSVRYAMRFVGELAWSTGARVVHGGAGGEVNSPLARWGPGEKRSLSWSGPGGISLVQVSKGGKRLGALHRHTVTVGLRGDRHLLSRDPTSQSWSGWVSGGAGTPAPERMKRRTFHWCDEAQCRGSAMAWGCTGARQRPPAKIACTTTHILRSAIDEPNGQFPEGSREATRRQKANGKLVIGKRNARI